MRAFALDASLGTGGPPRASKKQIPEKGSERMKRWMSVLTALALLVSALCVPALAADYVSASTPLGLSGARISNIRLAADAVNGTAVPYGGSFSFNGVVGARTSQRGYQSAENGRGVSVVGGGVAQVASTLYLALEQIDGISYDALKTYGDSYNQSYVSDPADAILVDESVGTDFAFTNYHGDMTIQMYISGDQLVCALNFDSVSGGTARSEATIYLSGTDALRNNVSLAAQAVNGTTLSSGDTFSFNDIVGERSQSRGYQSALNGRGVKVVGGGVAQVASAIWLAVKDLSDVVIVEKSTYGSRYNQNYVDSSADAILTDYGAGTDFSFRYTGTGSITIETYVSGDALVCRVSGASSGWDTGASGWESADSWDNGWNTGWNNASEVPTFE